MASAAGACVVACRKINGLQGKRYASAFARRGLRPARITFPASHSLIPKNRNS